MKDRDAISFIGCLENDPVLTTTTANRRLAVLCVSTSKLPLTPDELPPDQVMHRVVVWDENPNGVTSVLKRGDRILIHGVPAGPWKDADLDPYLPIEFVALSVRRLVPEAAATDAASRAELRREIFAAARVTPSAVRARRRLSS